MATLALVCTAVGALVVIGFTTLALVPMLFAVGVVSAWVLALLLLGWAGIEGLAALERWFENDSRFQR
ncbi:MAG: glypican [Synechococcaceae cyanobacterium ELA182]